MTEFCDAYSTMDIEVLEAWEAIRRRPGMYVGDVHDVSALHHMVWEVIANALEEHFGGYATRIRVSIEDDIAEVEDDGRGIPIDVVPGHDMSAVEYLLTRLDWRSSHVSPFGFTVGLVLVNALSEELEIEIRRDGWSWHQRYERGLAVSALERRTRTSRTGTRIRFRPDRGIFSKTHFDRAAIRARLEELALFNPELRWELMSMVIREPDGTPRWIERMAAESGLGRVEDVFATRGVRDGVFVEVACGWSSGPRWELRSFVSQRETEEGGTHERGFWRGIVLAVLNQGGRSLPKRRRWARIRERLAPGLLGMVHVGLPDPHFTGNTHSRLANRNAGDAVRDHLVDTFGRYLASRPALGRKLRKRAGGSI